MPGRITTEENVLARSAASGEQARCVPGRRQELRDLVGAPLGGLAEPPIADDDAGSLEFGFDADPFDVPLEPDGFPGELMLDVEHLAGLHQHSVVRETIADLVRGGAMCIPTDYGTKAPQVSRELLDRDAVLVTQRTHPAPMIGRLHAPDLPTLDARVPAARHQVVADHAEDRDEHHDRDGDPAEHNLVHVHHRQTLSRAQMVNKPEQGS